MNNNTYILLKDLPDAKAGTELVFDGNGTYDYKSHRTVEGDDETLSWYRKEFVENNPSWFKLKEHPIQEEQSVFSAEKITQQLDKLNFAEEAFNAARLTHQMVGFKFDTFQDFAQSKPLPTKEEVSKSWEILEFKRSSGTVIERSAFDWVDVERGAILITSVKRLTDGEVFEVGKENKFNGRTIQKFFIGWAGMEIHYTDGFRELLMVFLEPPKEETNPILPSYSLITETYVSFIKTMNRSKFMSKIENDGIYIRLAGNKDKDEIFSLEWYKVFDFKKDCQ